MPRSGTPKYENSPSWEGGLQGVCYKLTKTPCRKQRGEAFSKLRFPWKRGTNVELQPVYLKFSTSFRSLTISSICENRRDRPSGETERPVNCGADIGATVFTLPVTKLRNWMEDFVKGGPGMK